MLAVDSREGGTMTKRAAMLAAVVCLWAAAAQGQYTSGEFALRVFNKAGTVDITGIPQIANQDSNGNVVSNPTASSFFVFSVYLVQNAGPGPSIDTIGMSGIGARVNYANAFGGGGTPYAKVPAATGNSTTGNIVSNNEFDFVNRYGTGTTTDTTNSAAITEGLISNSDLVPLPGDFGDTGRIYIGTFKMQGQGTGGVVNVTVTDPFNPSNDFQTGPNPPAPDGTIGGAGGGPVITVDPFLTDYATPPSIAGFPLFTPIPEPGTLALCGLAAAAGLAVRGRRAARRATP
jgi:hypothetical protein